MDGNIEWKFEITSEVLAVARERLSWVLQRQNQGFVSRMPTARIDASVRQKVVLGVSLFGLGLVGWMWLRDPAWCVAHAFVWGSLSAFMVLAFVAGVFFPSTRRWSKRTAAKVLARQSKRFIDRLEAYVPYATSYRLIGSELTSVFERVTFKQHRRLDLRRARKAIFANPCVFLFRRETALLPFRMFYLPASPEYGAVLDAMLRMGAVAEEMSGPVEGYTLESATS